MKMTEQPTGRTVMTNREKQTILQLRLQKYSIRQIAEHTGRSATIAQAAFWKMIKNLKSGSICESGPETLMLINEKTVNTT